MGASSGPVAIAGGVTVAVGAALLTRQVRGRAGAAEDAARWRVVTVALPPDAVCPGGRPPEPLAGWGDAIEVRTRPAPGDRGTELSARLRDPEADGAPPGVDGDTPVQQLRSSLRRAKQILETGEVLRGPEPATARATPLNAPLRAAARLSGGVGRL